jgi:type IV pilus assembly protein PilE
MRTRHTYGFTLIELMIVVAVVAILAAIAIPSFASQMRKGRRAEAISTIQDAQIRLERWRVDHRDYTNNPASANYPAPTDTTYYDFTLTANAATPNNYTLVADAIGDQDNDVCGTLTITNINGRISKTAATTTGCW